MAGIFRFRRSRGPLDLAVDMAGVRLGERVLQAGVSDPRVFAILAGKAGLSGRACAVVDNAGAARLIEDAAAREGVLVEVAVAEASGWPFDEGAFDLGIVDGGALLSADAAARLRRLRDVHRAIRAGGRALIVRRWRPGPAERLGFGKSHAGPSPESSTLVQALGEAGFRPVRLLAEREGMTFVEGFRPAV